MKEFFPKLVIGFMIATTAATSAYAGMKLVEAPRPPIIATSNSPKDNSIKSQIESKIESLGEMFQMPSFIHNEDQKPQASSTSSASSARNSSARSFALASSSSSSRPSSAATNNSNDCVITLFGKQYKINSLLNTHSGGNIFNCGTDMTSIYQGKHGTNVNRMSSYLITTTNSSSTSTSSSTSLSSSSTSSSTTNPNDCIITLFGQQFKINSLLNTHSGGNIFNCGTDMTSIYQGKHGTNLSRMAKYAITAGGTTANSSSGSSSSSRSGHDDDEGEREEHRYED